MQSPPELWKRKLKWEETLKSTNFIIFMKSWVLLRLEGTMTTGMGNNRPESKPISFFLPVKIAYQADNKESNIFLPVPHIKQD